MLEELLKKCYDEEQAADKSAENIKTAVLSRIEADKTVKHFSVKPLIIAAAIAATGAISVVTANAATDGALMDNIVEAFGFFVNGTEVTGIVMEYTTADGQKDTRVEFELPEDADNASIVRPDKDDDFVEIRVDEHVAQIVWGNRLIKCD
ncbi:MAG: hypothetical protein K2G32_08600 [Oscillospiraceae bacterium]|nr:hypothetical protein [Oscillospiraceae bacterium]